MKRDTMIIKEWIKDSGLTQKQLAVKLGVNKSTVEHWCQDLTTPGNRSRRDLIELGVKL